MAGKRQHYLPRLLQSGFCDPSDMAKRTWLHRRDTDARLVSTRDIGVEDWFYSRKSLDGTPTLDDAITDLELDLSASVGALRQDALGSSIDPGEAARTVVHLVMRTAHLRRVISTGMTSITNEIESLFSNPVRLGGMIGVTKPTLASSVTDKIRERARVEQELAGIPAAFSERFASFELREHGEQLIEHAVTMFGPSFPQLVNGLAEMVRDAHNSILAATPESKGWVTALADFEWTVEAGVDLILPDAVALARGDDVSLTPMLFTRAADASAVVMPVSSDRVLVGRVAGSAPVNLGSFNQQAAASCQAFFVSGRSFDEDNLNALIGSAVFNTIQEKVSAAVHKIEEIRSTSDMQIASAEPLAFEQQEISFSVRTADFGDEVLAKEISDVLRGVVGALARNLPLHELDGFTLAVDYHGALAAVDRGDPELPPATSGALGYGVGVIKPVTVIRDGAQKKHIVIAAGLAEMWLSPDAKVRATGLYQLVKMLAEVAHSTLYANSCGSSFTQDSLGRELHLAVATAPAAYWSARRAAFIDPDQGQDYADLVIDSLDFTEREIADERARIPESGDIGNTAIRSLECVSAVLGHAADWLGHRDGLTEDQLFMGSDLPERLKTRGLDRWIDLFGRDLAACYGSDDVLNLEIVANLSQHVERLFWSLGIFCWPEGDVVQCFVTDQSYRPGQLP